MGDDTRDRQGRLSRRRFLRTTALGSLAAGAATGAGSAGAALRAGQAAEALPDRPRLVRLAHALLPSELTPGQREGVADALLAWLRGYRSGVTMDHGYGRTRIRETDSSPGPRYAEEVAALDAEASARFGAPLQRCTDEQVRTLAAEAVERTAPDMEGIPSRPDAPHVVLAVLSTYYRSTEATDRAYGARIGQETCRGLFTDVEGLQPYGPGISDSDREAGR